MKLENKAKLYLLITAIIWGLGFIGVQNALDNGWAPFPLLMMRGLIGGCFLLPFSLKTKWWRNIKMIKGSFLIGFFYFLGFAFQTIGQQTSSVANSAFLTALNVMFVPLILRLIQKQKLKKEVFVSCLFALIGTAVLSFNGTFQLMQGDLFLILGALFFALQIIYAKQVSQFNDPIAITILQLFVMALCSLFCMPLTQQMNIPQVGWPAVFFVAIFSSAFAFLFQIMGQAHVSPSTATILLSQESTIATAASVIILHQPFTLQIFIGGFLMISAVLICEQVIPLPRRKK